MRRKLPSTTALAAFEAAARHGSYTLAAAELALTQSAVSRQVAALQAQLGVKLFLRSRRGVLLTEAGAAYAEQVRQRLQELERDALALAATRGAGGGVLELATVPTFGTRWLLPRLPRFVAAHPGITVHLHSRIRPFLFDGSGLDAALSAGHAPWPGTEQVPLLPETLVVVASPALAVALKPARGACKPRHLAGARLIQMATRPLAWRHWFQAQGLQLQGDLAGPRMELYGMVAEAAVQGLGVALVPRLLVQAELRSAALLQLLPFEQDSGNTYSLILPQASAERPALQALKAWLLSEVAEAAGLPSAST